MKALLTAPIQQSSLEGVQSSLKKLPQTVQAVEIWVDQLKSADRTPQKIETACLSWLKNSQKRKLIVVCKDLVERGKYKGEVDDKIELLLAASRAGAHYIDIGFHCGKPAVRKLVMQNKKSSVIVSFHEFEKTPSLKRLQSLASQMKAVGADVIKIATLVHGPEDNERLMQLAMDLQKQKLRHVIIGMGQLGITTRVFSDHLGNELNFVTLENKTAPGQLSLQQMLQFQKVFNT